MGWPSLLRPKRQAGVVSLTESAAWILPGIQVLTDHLRCV